jgi:hypothetical protein
MGTSLPYHVLAAPKRRSSAATCCVLGASSYARVAGPVPSVRSPMRSLRHGAFQFQPAPPGGLHSVRTATQHVVR